ncbi:uncharacterized protein LOC34620738 [Cyclospora cayetanensis]|uniref:Uncharacterized protein LOC34620738 n=1 Tax=Cyclospora cayetanensis TaxID=88456 RepID=A0A6P6RSF2_9EIME|nr:uncharacterized protein LOC34620738 [Cyclospora cayetanensis]
MPDVVACFLTLRLRTAYRGRNEQLVQAAEKAFQKIEKLEALKAANIELKAAEKEARCTAEKERRELQSQLQEARQLVHQLREELQTVRTKKSPRKRLSLSSSKGNRHSGSEDLLQDNGRNIEREDEACAMEYTRMRLAVRAKDRQIRVLQAELGELRQQHMEVQQQSNKQQKEILKLAQRLVVIRRSKAQFEAKAARTAVALAAACEHMEKEKDEKNLLMELVCTRATKGLEESRDSQLPPMESGEQVANRSMGTCGPQGSEPLCSTQAVDDERAESDDLCSINECKSLKINLKFACQSPAFELWKMAQVPLSGRILCQNAGLLMLRKVLSHRWVGDNLCLCSDQSRRQSAQADMHEQESCSESSSPTAAQKPPDFLAKKEGLNKRLNTDHAFAEGIIDLREEAERGLEQMQTKAWLDSSGPEGESEGGGTAEDNTGVTLPTFNMDRVESFHTDQMNDFADCFTVEKPKPQHKAQHCSAQGGCSRIECSHREMSPSQMSKKSLLGSEPQQWQKGGSNNARTSLCNKGNDSLRSAVQDDVVKCSLGRCKYGSTLQAQKDKCTILGFATSTLADNGSISSIPLWRQLHHDEVYNNIQWSLQEQQSMYQDQIMPLQQVLTHQGQAVAIDRNCKTCDSTVAEPGGGLGHHAKQEGSVEHDVVSCTNEALTAPLPAKYSDTEAASPVKRQMEQFPGPPAGPHSSTDTPALGEALGSSCITGNDRSLSLEPVLSSHNEELWNSISAAAPSADLCASANKNTSGKLPSPCSVYPSVCSTLVEPLHPSNTASHNGTSERGIITIERLQPTQRASDRLNIQELQTRHGKCTKVPEKHITTSCYNSQSGVKERTKEHHKIDACSLMETSVQRKSCVTSSLLANVGHSSTHQLPGAERRKGEKCNATHFTACDHSLQENNLTCQEGRHRALEPFMPRRGVQTLQGRVTPKDEHGHISENGRSSSFYACISPMPSSHCSLNTPRLSASGHLPAGICSPQSRKHLLRPGSRSSSGSMQLSVSEDSRCVTPQYLPSTVEYCRDLRNPRLHGSPNKGSSRSKPSSTDEVKSEKIPVREDYHSDFDFSESLPSFSVVNIAVRIIQRHWRLYRERMTKRQRRNATMEHNTQKGASLQQRSARRPISGLHSCLEQEQDRAAAMKGKVQGDSPPAPMHFASVSGFASVSSLRPELASRARTNKTDYYKVLGAQTKASITCKHGSNSEDDEKQMETTVDAHGISIGLPNATPGKRSTGSRLHQNANKATPPPHTKAESCADMNRMTTVPRLVGKTHHDHKGPVRGSPDSDVEFVALLEEAEAHHGAKSSSCESRHSHQCCYKPHTDAYGDDKNRLGSAGGHRSSQQSANVNAQQRFVSHSATPREVEMQRTQNRNRKLYTQEVLCVGDSVTSAEATTSVVAGSPKPLSAEVSSLTGSPLFSPSIPQLPLEASCNPSSISFQSKGSKPQTIHPFPAAHDSHSCSPPVCTAVPVLPCPIARQLEENNICPPTADRGHCALKRQHATLERTRRQKPHSECTLNRCFLVLKKRKEPHYQER